MAEIETLICLFKMQPATVSLVEIARGTATSSVPGMLRRLIEKGLAHREKSPPQPSLTAEEKTGFTAGQLRLGKRPYLYRLTPKGERIAHWLNLASEEFRLQKPDDNALIGHDMRYAP